MRSIRLMRFQAVVFLLAVLLSFPGQATAAPHDDGILTDQEKGILNSVESAIGKILPESAAPGTYAHLKAVFQRVSESQSRLFPRDAAPFNSIRLIDSPEENAFVAQVAEPATPSKSTHLVFITTGLLEKLYPASGKTSSVTQADLKQGEIRLAGILSHELAHPFRSLPNVEGEKSWWKRALGSQAVELITDFDGMGIAEGAGYPRDSLQQALKTFLPSPGAASGPSIVEAGASTHPEGELRQGAGRLALTEREFSRGPQKTPQIGTQATAALVKELQQLKAKSLRIHVAPKTIEEAAQRIAALKDAQAPLRQIELNRLVVDLDEMVRAKEKDGLTENEWKGFLGAMKTLGNFRGELGSKDWVHVFDRSEADRAYSAENGSEGYRSRPTHGEYLETSWVYRDPKYLAWAGAGVLNASRIKPYDTGKFPELLTEAVRLLPPGAVFRERHEAIAQELRGLPFASVADLESQYGTEVKIRLAHLYHAEVFSPSLLDDKWPISDYRPWPTFLLPFTQFGDSVSPVDTPDFKALPPELKAELQGLRRETLGRIWQNAGAWGAMDLLIAKENIDWPMIWKELGIPPETGTKELNRKVREFCNGPGYAKMLAALTPDKLQRNYGGNWKLRRKGKPPLWPEDDLWAALSKAGKNDPGVPYEAPQLVRHFYFRTYPERFKKSYRSTLHELMQKQVHGPSLGLLDVYRLHSQVMDLLLGGGEREALPATIDEAWAAEIDQSSLPPQAKQDLLKKLFVEGFHDDRLVHVREINALSIQDTMASDFLHPLNLESVPPQGRTDKQAVLDILRRHGIALSLMDTLRTSLSKKDYGTAFEVVSGFHETLATELNALKTPPPGASSDRRRWLAGHRRKLMEFATQVMDRGAGPPPKLDGDAAIGGYQPARGYPSYSRAEQEQGNSVWMRRLKAKVLEAADSLGLPDRDKQALFGKLTDTGGSEVTDAYFRKSFARLLSEPLTSRSHRFLTWALEQKRIQSSPLRAQVAKKLLWPRLDAIRTRPASTAEVGALLKQLQVWVPEATHGRDDLLEELAWKLQLRGRGLALLEEHKSYNPKLLNPSLARLGSVFAAIVSRLRPDSRLALMEHILHPEVGPLPKELEEEAVQVLKEDLRKSSGGAKGLAQEHEIKLRAKAREFRTRLENALMDSRRSERIPMLEMLIHAGRSSLASDPAFPSNVTARILKSLAPGSVEDRLLRILLKNVPGEMQATALSTLLAQQQDGGALEPARIYEAFGPFGIRFAQMVSRWDLFGPEHSAKIAHLKHRARPLTLAQVERIAKETLSEEEYARIESFEEILGGGTNRTAVKVRLKNGSTPVMLVQRPYARQQIEGTADLVRKALADARKENLFSELDLVEFLVEDTRAQMLSELHGPTEAARIRRASLLYAALNEDPRIRESLKGYRFVVPQPLPESQFKVYDNLFFLERFDGQVFAEAPQETQSALGEAIVLSGLEGRLVYGVGNVDAHKGNFLVNPRTGEIGVIDVGGWWYELSEGDRLAWRDFLVAASQGSDSDVQALMEAGLKLAASQPTTEQRSRIEEGLKRAMKEFSVESPRRGAMMIQRAFELNGARMRPEVKFAGLMELLVLSGEGYVSPEAFKTILSEQVMKSLLSPRGELPVGDCLRDSLRVEAASGTPAHLNPGASP